MTLYKFFIQLADSKKKVDEDQQEIEELQGAKRKVDKEIESLHERIEELTAENQKTARSKKKIQGEVSNQSHNMPYWFVCMYVHVCTCMCMYVCVCGFTHMHVHFLYN